MITIIYAYSSKLCKIVELCWSWLTITICLLVCLHIIVYTSVSCAVVFCANIVCASVYQSTCTHRNINCTMCVSLSVCLSLSLSVCLSASVSVCLSVCMSLSLSLSRCVHCLASLNRCVRVNMHHHCMFCLFRSLLIRKLLRGYERLPPTGKFIFRLRDTYMSSIWLQYM